ncbi:MAG: ribonuclease Y [Nitrospinae bacterium]|nr:ribonuclease Y [Nitrospinota bacterium]
MNLGIQITLRTVSIGIGIWFVGMAIGYLLRRFVVESKLKDSEKLAKMIISEAEKEAENKKKEAEIEVKDFLFKSRTDIDKELREKKNEMAQIERRMAQKESEIEKKLFSISQSEKELSKKEKDLDETAKRAKDKETRYQNLIDEQLLKLEKLSGLSMAEAKEELKMSLFQEARSEAANELKKIEEETKLKAEEKSSKIISLAIQRYAADHVAESTVSIVDLPNDEMKGRIIGREGRNIRALEIATGMDLIIDDTPEAVILSGFDPIRREVARLALEKLISDGRIHPARIEDVVNKAKKEIATKIREEGEKTALECGIDGLHPEEIKLLGRLKYRTSYSQNILQHSKEVCFLCGIMAAELGVNVKLAKRAGLLHDIGKAIDHQTDGTHTQIGVDIARRYREPKVVINAIASHHEDVEAESVIAVLVAAADAISASRPGARREMLESYVKRLTQLEEITTSFKGVEKTFAIQAGREIRIIVEPETIKDADTQFLAKDIAKKIEKEMAYPGEIKVTVVRETRAVEYAR